MTKLERLKKEQARAAEQVERFERKYKQHDTCWHVILKRVTAEIRKLEAKKKKPTQKSKAVEKENDNG